MSKTIRAYQCAKLEKTATPKYWDARKRLERFAAVANEVTNNEYHFAVEVISDDDSQLTLTIGYDDYQRCTLDGIRRYVDIPVSSLIYVKRKFIDIRAEQFANKVREWHSRSFEEDWDWRIAVAQGTEDAFYDKYYWWAD